MKESPVSLKKQKNARRNVYNAGKKILKRPKQMDKGIQEGAAADELQTRISIGGEGVID